MHPDLAKLLELQRTDAEISRLKQEIAALPKRVAEIETRLAGNIASVEKAKADSKNNEQNRRKCESEIQSVQLKISKYRDQMLAVKTNDEYRALGNEIKFAEEAIRGLEDKILECMVQGEELEKNIKAAEQSLSSERAEVEKEKSQARAHTTEYENAAKELEPKRAELRNGVSENLLHQYDRVLKSRGMAMSEARDQKCMACNVMLRPQAYNDVRDNTQAIICDSCGRILYYDESRDQENEPATKPATSTQNGTTA